MIAVGKIRGWLLKHPKPATLRLTVEDEPQTMVVKGSYSKLAENIAQIDPETIEAFDKQGNVLRVLKADAEEAQRSDAAAIPKGLENDSNAAMLAHFANLLHRAYEHSSEIAFNKMVEIFGIQASRAEAIEQRLERAEASNRRLISEQIADAFERADEAQQQNGKGSFLDEMVAAFVQGQQLKQQPAPANGAQRSNGQRNGKAPASKGDA